MSYQFLITGVALSIFIFVLCAFSIINLAEEGSSDLAFCEPSSRNIDLNVNITQQSRDYSEHFHTYKFWYTMRIAVSRDADMIILQ